MTNFSSATLSPFFSALRMLFNCMLGKTATSVRFLTLNSSLAELLRMLPHSTSESTPTRLLPVMMEAYSDSLMICAVTVGVDDANGRGHWELPPPLPPSPNSVNAAADDAPPPVAAPLLLLSPPPPPPMRYVPSK